MQIPEFLPIPLRDETAPRDEGIPPGIGLLVATIIPRTIHLVVDHAQEPQNETVLDIHRQGMQDNDVARAQGPRNETIPDTHRQGIQIIAGDRTIPHHEGTVVLHAPGPVNTTGSIRDPLVDFPDPPVDFPDPLVDFPDPLLRDAEITLVLGRRETLTHAPHRLGTVHRYTLNAPKGRRHIFHHTCAHLLQTPRFVIYQSLEHIIALLTQDQRALDLIPQFI